MGLLDYPSKLVGLLSFIPGALALIATTFNFDQRAKLHRRKARELNDLKGRFIFQMPTLPSADQTALIHREMTVIESRIGKDEEDIKADWNPVNAGTSANPPI